MTKYMTIEDYLIGRSIAQLEEEFKQLDDVINNVGCFGVRDLSLFDAIGRELDRRENENE